jgi:hypothetical protein
VAHVLEKRRDGNPPHRVEIDHQQVGRVELGEVPAAGHYQRRGFFGTGRFHGVVGQFDLLSGDFIQVGLIDEVPARQGGMPIPAPHGFTHLGCVERAPGRTPRAGNDSQPQTGRGVHVGGIEATHHQRKPSRMDCLQIGNTRHPIDAYRKRF